VLVIVQPFFGGMPGWPNTGEGGTSTTSRAFTTRRQ
jgi:hypothetical protein